MNSIKRKKKQKNINENEKNVKKNKETNGINNRLSVHKNRIM
jgi:hypothetical protein